MCKTYLVHNEINAKNNPAYKARIFGLYIVEDETLSPEIGYRHQWEHAIAWLHNNQLVSIVTTEHKRLDQMIDNKALDLDQSELVAPNNTQVVDYQHADGAFKQMLKDQSNWGEAAPKVDDADFLNQFKPATWANVEF